MSSFGIKIAQQLFNGRIHDATRTLLTELADIDGVAQRQVEGMLRRIAGQSEACFPLGETEWGFPISIPLPNLLAHSLVVGTTGAGKSYGALLLLAHSLERFTSGNYLPIGILDAKGELAAKAIEYMQAHAYRLPKENRERLGKKVFVIDFSRSDLVTPHNILACKAMPAELLVNNRIETISQIYHGSSALTARMKSILKYFMLLLIEHGLPITMFEKLCLDTDLVKSLAAKSKDERLRQYFANRFPKEPKGTILGLRQRIDSLFVSDGVRLSLSAQSTPDFQRLQDEGYFVVINVAGPHISRGTSEFLLRVVLSDIRQSVFRRQSLEKKYLWCLDEAQILYKDSASRENMNDLLTMARSFGSYFMLLTQSVTSAVQDVDILNSILANIRWMLMFRSTLRDAKIISPAIPVTGTALSTKRHLYDQQKFLTKDQELNMRLEEITHFPERTGYLWLRSDLPKAIKMKTRQLAPPEEIAGCGRKEFAAFVREHPIGNLVPRRQIEKELKEMELRLVHEHSPTASDIDSGANNTHDTQDFIRFLENNYAKKTGNTDRS